MAENLSAFHHAFKHVLKALYFGNKLNQTKLIEIGTVKPTLGFRGFLHARGVLETRERRSGTTVTPVNQVTAQEKPLVPRVG